MFQYCRNSPRFVVLQFSTTKMSKSYYSTRKTNHLLSVWQRKYFEFHKCGVYNVIFLVENYTSFISGQKPALCYMNESGTWVQHLSKILTEHKNLRNGTKGRP